jgi:hypothetical protein
VDAGSNFEIKGVAPGAYELWVEANDAGKRLVARMPLTVAEEDVENLELIATAERDWTGRISVADGGSLPANASPRVRLEPRSERGATVEVPVRNSGAGKGEFRFALASEDTYDVFLAGQPSDLYLSMVRINGTDVRAMGVTGSMDPGSGMELVLDSRGGRLNGQVFGPAGDVWSGASVVLIPEPPRGRLQDYREVPADEYGQFQIRGIRPGQYTLVAWLDEPPCDVYDPEALDACRATGMAVTVEAASEQSFAFNVRAPRQ